MKKITNVLVLLVALVALTSQMAKAQDEFKPSGKVFGTVFGDYYWVASAANSTDTKPVSPFLSGANSFNSNVKDFSAFDFRRIQLGYTYNFTPTLMGQISYDNDGTEATVSSVASGASAKNLAPNLRDAYIKWEIFKGSNLWIGLQPTFTYDASDKVWGHRFIEREVTDFRGSISSRDQGISLRGKIDEKGLFNYAVMLGNSSGTSYETDKYKTVYGLLAIKPIDGLEIDLFANDNIKQANTNPSGTDMSSIVYGAFAGIKKEKFSFGLEYFSRSDKNAWTDPASKSVIDLNGYGFSIYATGKITNKLGAFARYDISDPNTSADSKGDSRTMGMVGLDWFAISNLVISPNIEWEGYEDLATTPPPASGSSIKSTMLARLTFYWKF